MGSRPTVISDVGHEVGEPEGEATEDQSGGEAIRGALGDGQDPPQQDREADEQECDAHEPQLLAHDGDDEVGMLLR